MTSYCIWYGLAAICALGCAAYTRQQSDKMSLLLGKLYVSVAAVNLLYLLERVYADAYQKAEIFNCLFLVALDLLLFALLRYIVEFTEPKTAPTKGKKNLLWGLLVLLCMDVLLRLFDGKYSFYLHMAFCCCLLGSMLYFLIKKIYMIPRVYRGRYYVMLGILGILAAANVFCLLEATPLRGNVSLILMGCLCPMLYWNTFDYTSKSSLNTTRKMILEYMGAPMILFDYEGYVADSNRDMRVLFPILNNKERKISMMDFLQIGAFKELQNTEQDQIFEWNYTSVLGNRPYQCNFNCLKDEKGRVIGHLLIMRNMEEQRDMLTQLHSKQNFFTRMDKIAQQGVYPITVAICNANGVGLINDVFGWNKGNEMIRLTADLLRENLPKNTELARMEDGNIAAGFVQVEQEYAIRLFENVREKYSQANDTGIESDLEYGIAVVRDSSKSIQQAVREAAESLRTKKLMNETSNKSSLLDSLTQTLTESDYETEEHVERTKEMAVKLGRALHLSDGELGKLALLAVLHDIGKIAIPQTILLKPGKLTDEEWEVMKSHAEKGFRIASASKELRPIADYILHHHERWDGKGYPGGLEGESIPLLSRIITVVDSHDVMVHDRPYHKAMSEEDAEKELVRCAGTQFDPHIVEVFLEVLKHNTEGKKTE